MPLQRYFALLLSVVFGSVNIRIHSRIMRYRIRNICSNAENRTFCGFNGINTISVDINRDRRPPAQYTHAVVTRNVWRTCFSAAHNSNQHVFIVHAVGVSSWWAASHKPTTASRAPRQHKLSAASHRITHTICICSSDVFLRIICFNLINLKSIW